MDLGVCRRGHPYTRRDAQGRPHCRVCHARRAREARARQSEEQRERQRAWGRASALRRYRQDRAAVRAAYGGKCQVCGEEDDAVLDIHHVDDDGAEHRRLVGTSPWSVWRDVLRQGCPPNYRLLCANDHRRAHRAS